MSRPPLPHPLAVEVLTLVYERGLECGFYVRDVSPYLSTIHGLSGVIGTLHRDGIIERVPATAWTRRRWRVKNKPFWITEKERSE